MYKFIVLCFQSFPVLFIFYISCIIIFNCSKDFVLTSFPFLFFRGICLRNSLLCIKHSQLAFLFLLQITRYSHDSVAANRFFKGINSFPSAETRKVERRGLTSMLANVLTSVVYLFGGDRFPCKKTIENIFERDSNILLGKPLYQLQ